MEKELPLEKKAKVVNFFNQTVMETKNEMIGSVEVRLFFILYDECLMNKNR